MVVFWPLLPRQHPQDYPVNILTITHSTSSIAEVKPLQAYLVARGGTTGESYLLQVVDSWLKCPVFWPLLPRQHPHNYLFNILDRGS